VQPESLSPATPLEIEFCYAPRSEWPAHIREFFEEQSADVGAGGKMKANLEWVNREWENWLKSEVGRKVVGTGRVKEHPEHIAKLFSAFCLEQLSAAATPQPEAQEASRMRRWEADIRICSEALKLSPNSTVAKQLAAAFPASPPSPEGRAPSGKLTVSEIDGILRNAFPKDGG
jgi:hypothetical protein